MSLFSKKKDNVFNANEEFEIQSVNFGQKNINPNALTPQEVMHLGEKEEELYDSAGALEALKKRLSAVARKDNEATAKPHIEKKLKTTAEIVAEISTKKAEATVTKQVVKETEDTPKHSLMHKCMPFFVDEKGQDTTIENEPLYKLQSVAEILENDSKEAIQRLYERYGIPYNPSQFSIETKPEIEKKPKEKEINDSAIQIGTAVKNLQTSVPFVISDIDDSTVVSQKQEAVSTDTTTITFTPVSDNTSSTHLNVSTQTRPIDIIPELINNEEDYKDTSDNITLEKSEFEEYTPKEEFHNKENISALGKKFFLAKRASFISATVSVFVTVILALFKLPFLSGIILSHTFESMIICTSLVALSIFANYSMFKAIKNAFTKKSSPDITVVFASAFTLIFSIYGIIKGEIINDMLLLLSIILSVRALSDFWKNSYTLSNFKQIANNSTKNAIRLIDDPAVTFAMAKGSIEGDTLIAANCKTEHIKDFMKYSTYGLSLGGKLPILLCFSLILSIGTGLSAAAYFDGVFYGLYAASAIQCFSALPILFLIDNLPLYRIAQRLNKIGAMIAGKKGAEHLEMANAVVLNSCDLFPEGTVTLHQMKVLSDNNLEDTLVRAAALTQYMNSPLAPIFKTIVKTRDISSLPNTDTVKYEDRLGISGWVNNRLLIIGNRALMESRGIEIPSLEFDRKILRRGYFPVYVATGEKACALLMVQYSVNPEVARDLKYLSKLGITMLINNTDPNLTEEMICDYLGLYDDSVKVMSSVGTHVFKNNNPMQKSCSAPAAYKTNRKALPKILGCANKFKKCNLLLSVLYFISAPLGAIIFAYTSFGGSGELITQTALLLYSIVVTAISYLLYLIQRP